jgi:hypothetical protein
VDAVVAEKKWPEISRAVYTWIEMGEQINRIVAGWCGVGGDCEPF